MSMILDALRKSDRERARAATERLREGPSIAVKRNPVAWVIAVAAAVVLALAAWVLLLTQWPDRAARTATGTTPEIMENDRPGVRAAVRDLAGELVRVAPGSAPEPVGPAAPTRAEIVENLAAPPLENLPAAIRIKLPELQVNVHAWSENPRERFVLINLRRYQEGDRLQEGPLLHRILRNGVVLEYEGTLFTLSRQ